MNAQQITNIICSVIIGASIVAGFYLLRPLNHIFFDEGAVLTAGIEEGISVQDYPLMDIEQTARYMNMTKEQVLRIIYTEKAHLEKYNSFNGMMLPYVKFGEDIYVSKSALLDWIKDVTTNRREYGTELVL